MGTNGTRTYSFDHGGHLSGVTAGANQVDFYFDASGRLDHLERHGAAAVAFTYDGRGFLSLASGAASRAGKKASPRQTSIFSDGFETGDTSRWSCTQDGSGSTCEYPSLAATYTSDGLLRALQNETRNHHVLYFAGRPLATFEQDVATNTWTYLSTDHLGTPVLATTDTGAEAWSGGFEPFGEDWRAGTATGASESGIFLRFPGQWHDPLWGDAGLGAEVYYNVHRWYEWQVGRYSRLDPIRSTPGLAGAGAWRSPYSYGLSSPLVLTDPLGLIECEGEWVPYSWWRLARSSHHG